MKIVLDKLPSKTCLLKDIPPGDMFTTKSDMDYDPPDIFMKGDVVVSGHNTPKIQCMRLSDGWRFDFGDDLRIVKVFGHLVVDSIGNNPDQKTPAEKKTTSKNRMVPFSEIKTGQRFTYRGLVYFRRLPGDCWNAQRVLIPGDLDSADNPSKFSDFSDSTKVFPLLSHEFHMFGDLNIGDRFIYNEIIFVKTDMNHDYGTCNATALCFGGSNSSNFSKHCKVTKIPS